VLRKKYRLRVFENIAEEGISASEGRGSRVEEKTS
jgi:hypothetical protein